MRFFCLMILSIILISCDNGDEVVQPKDETNPIITLLSPTVTAGAKVWNSVQIKTEVSDEALASVKVYLNSTLLIESSNSSVEINLDTRNYEDGNYKIKVQAVDKSGNQAETAIDVEIYNKLVVINVSDNYITNPSPVDFQSWVFLSSKSGALLGSYKIENGANLVFQRPANFNDDEFSYSIFSYSIFDFGSLSHDNVLTTYTNCKPGTYYLRQGFNTTGPKIGESGLSVTGLSGIWKVNANVNGTPSYYLSFSSGVLDVKVDVYKNADPAKIFLSVIETETANPIYLFRDNLKSGTITTANRSDFVTSKSLQLPVNANDFSRVTVYGSPYADSRSEIFTLQSGANKGPVDMHSIFYPDGIFSEYRTLMTYGRDGIRYFYRNVTPNKPASEIKELSSQTFALSEANNEHKVVVTSTGSFDYATINAFINYSIGTDEYTFTWAIITPSENRGFIVNEFPEILKTKFLFPNWEEFDFDGYGTCYDYTGIDGFRDYTDFYLMSSEDINSRIQEYMFKEGFSKSIGGRIKDDYSINFKSYDFLGKDMMPPTN